MLEHHDIATLVVCVRVGTLGGAARSLKVSPSTLSRRVARLEDQLGLALLERGRFGVKLTAAGRAIIPHAELALRELEAIRRTGLERGRGEVGTVHLGLRFPPASEPITSMLRAWHERYPSVALSIVEGFDDDLERALGQREIDVILTIASAAPDRAATQSLHQEPLLAVLPERHRLSGNELVLWQDIPPETVLVPDETFRTLISNHLGGDSLVQLHRVSVQSLVALVAMGFGVTIVPTGQACTSVAGVVFKSIEPTVTVDIALAWLPELEDATVGRFIAFMRDAAARSGHLASRQGV